MAKGRNNSTFAELARTCHTPKTRTRTHTCPFPFRSLHVNRQRDTYHADCRNGNEGGLSERTGGGKGTTEEPARTERIGEKKRDKDSARQIKGGGKIYRKEKEQ